MTDRIRPDLHEQNRLSWNEATKAHNSHKGDQAAFLRAGGSTLFPEEVELLGAVSGKPLVHLQCNAGQDSLSIARLGAGVTGVDISDEAVEFARRLSHDAGIRATFERADVYDWLREAARQGRVFDIAFASYGALPWLSDIAAWAAGIARVLRPGGRLVLMEFHPVGWLFDDDWSHRWPYFWDGKPFTSETGVRDYVAASDTGLTPKGYEEGVREFTNPHAAHSFSWTIGEIIGAVLAAGLTLETFREYPYVNGCKVCTGMRETPGRRMTPPENVPNLPLMYGLTARK